MKMISISIALAITGCTSGHNGTDVDASSGDGSPWQGSDGSSSAKPTIFTIVLENHDYAEIIGSSNAPYINSLLAQGALATNYKDTNHPSLPNYLHMISGADQYPGFIDLDPTFTPFPVTAANLGTQLEAAHVTWRSYQESMGMPCRLSASGKYAPKHDPFLYFKDMQTTALCTDRNVDYSQFAADLASNTYRYMWITPNLTSDGHDPATNPVMGLQTSDTWMKTEVPKILASDGFKAGGILFITWDEAEGRANNDKDKIPMIILSPRVKQAGMTSATAFTHSSYLATIEDLLALPRLPTVTSTPALMEFLNP
ncbi:MAG: putative acid phosphatase [Myxococcales bacterium]|nr:putative acid phosphatase [Myxococcales bacterium]